MRPCPYLVRRNTTFYFRIAVPRALVARIGRAEIKASLGTSRYAAALPRARACGRACHLLFESLPFMPADFTVDLIQKIVRFSFEQILLFEHERHSRYAIEERALGLTNPEIAREGQRHYAFMQHVALANLGQSIGAPLALMTVLDQWLDRTTPMSHLHRQTLLNGLLQAAARAYERMQERIAGQYIPIPPDPLLEAGPSELPPGFADRLKDPEALRDLAVAVEGFTLCLLMSPPNGSTLSAARIARYEEQNPRNAERDRDLRRRIDAGDPPPDVLAYLASRAGAEPTPADTAREDIPPRSHDDFVVMSRERQHRIEKHRRDRREAGPPPEQTATGGTTYHEPDPVPVAPAVVGNAPDVPTPEGLPAGNDGPSPQSVSRFSAGTKVSEGSERETPSGPPVANDPPAGERGTRRRPRMAEINRAKTPIDLLDVLWSAIDAGNPKTREDYKLSLTLLTHVCEHRPVGDLTHDDIREYVSLVRRLPARASGKATSDPYAAVAEADERERATGQPVPRLSEATIRDKRCANTRRFCGFLFGEGILPVDLSTVITHPKRKDKGRPRNRMPFRTKELRAIFALPGFRASQSEHYFHKVGTVRVRNWKWWGFIIAVMTGMRSEEIAQLTVNDVFEKDGSWWLRVSNLPDPDDPEDHDPKVKNRNSRRIVPVHPQLVDIGLIRLVHHRRRTGDARLFPDWQASGSQVSGISRYSNTMSKHFNRTVKTHAGITSPWLVFHSARHSFKDRLDEWNVDPLLARQIMGHAEMDCHDTYGSGDFRTAATASFHRLDFSDCGVTELRYLGDGTEATTRAEAEAMAEPPTRTITPRPTRRPPRSAPSTSRSGGRRLRSIERPDTMSNRGSGAAVHPIDHDGQSAQGVPQAD